jgi:hypothetical protein
LKPVEYVFRIDVFTPETLPMGRLALYLAALAKMYGHEEHTHFIGVEPGSARLRTAVDPVDAPKVEARLNNLRIGQGTKDAASAKLLLEDLLANDNAVGALSVGDSDHIIIPFVGRNRPTRIIFPAFREDTTIDGVLVRIGGRDSTAHATLLDGETVHLGVTMSHAMARQLAPLIYGPALRLHGNGRFERQSDGVWKMSDFRVDRHEVLDDRPIHQVLETIREIPGNRLMDESSYRDISAQRDDEGYSAQ